MADQVSNASKFAEVLNKYGFCHCPFDHPLDDDVYRNIYYKNPENKLLHIGMECKYCKWKIEGESWINFLKEPAPQIDL